MANPTQEMDYRGLTLVCDTRPASVGAVALTGTGGTSTGTMTTVDAVVTTAALTTAAGATHVATITFTGVTTSDLAYVTLAGGTNTVLGLTFKATCTANTLTISITNVTAGAVNGTIAMNVKVVKGS